MSSTRPATGSPTAALGPRADAPWAYAEYAQQAERLLAPLAALMQPGASALPLVGPPSDHGEAADRFEAFARPCLLASLWLRSTDHHHPTDPSLDPEKIAAWFRDGLALGTDPTSDQFWGVLPSFHQFAVEMAILVMAIDCASDRLWAPLPDDVKARVATWLGQIRGHAGHHNNHLFFDLLTLEFLGEVGFAEPEDRPCIDWLFAELETMHRSGGWFIDGTNENYDHYNAYAFHIYGLYWVWRYGDKDPERADRWKTWAASFLPEYTRFFASSGEPVPFGRSLTYRFNGVGVYPMAAALGIETVPTGVMRRVSRRCIDFFTSRPIEQDQGCLSIGWTDEYTGLAEPYSCAGSPYWAAKGFLMLLLDPQHAFFTDPEQPMPSETDAPPVVIDAPGYVVRNIPNQRADSGTPSGDVELINAGGWSSLSAATRFGQWKWGRLAYRTGVGSLYPEAPSIIPPDAGLTASRPGSDEWFGRHKTLPITVGAEHLAAAYTLSAPKSGFNVSVVTDAWWNAGWLLLVHRARCAQACTLRSGGFAIAGDAGDAPVVDAAVATVSVSTTNQASQAGALSGWDRAGVIVESTDEPRRHLYAPGSQTPVLEADAQTGVTTLAEVLWCGAASSVPPMWRAESLAPGLWSLRTDRGDAWEIHHDRLPAMPANQNDHTKRTPQNADATPA